MTIVIQINSLVKTLHGGGHKVEILKSLDLTVPTGQFIAITGPSGSGKTTLLSLIAGLDNPTSGQIMIDEQNITKLDEDELAHLRGKRFGFISEQRGSKLNLVTTGNSPVLSFNYRTKRGEKKTREENLLDFVDVKGWKAMGNKLGNYLRMSGFSWLMENKDVEEDAKIEDESMDELTLFN